MAGLTQALCTSFKVECLTGTHNFTVSTGDTFKMALFTAGASIVGTYGASTANYSEMTADEVASGGGYTTGGKVLTSVTPVASGTTAVVDFSDATWTSATFVARGAMIYNSSKSNKAVCILDFGADKTVTAGPFTVYFPTPDASNAIVRIE